VSAGPSVISVFGGSGVQPGTVPYREAEATGRAIAQAGLAVATGGYIGAMEAVSRGAAEAGGRVIGVTCDQIERWRPIRPNPWVQQEIRHPTLRERAYGLIEIGAALIALPGGVGTLSEVALAWSLLQTGEIGPRPVVLIGDGWHEIFAAFTRSAGSLLHERDADLLEFAPDGVSAVRMVAARLGVQGF
jgi:uncharacterized protein (TIGR00730 family)